LGWNKNKGGASAYGLWTSRPSSEQNCSAPDAATSLLPVTIIQAGRDKSQQHLQIYGRLVLL